MSPGGTSPIAWEWRVTGVEGVEALVDEWEALAIDTDAPATARPEWLRSYWRAFGAPPEALRVHALYEDGRLAVVLPLRKVGGAFPAWVSLHNPHVPYLAFPVRDPSAETGRSVLRHLLADSCCLDLRPLPADSVFGCALAEAARAEGLPVASEPAEAGLHIDMPGPGAKSPAVETLARKLRKPARPLERLGTLRFEVIERGPLEPVLAECFHLEGLGWKGVSGSPISSRPDTLRFYTDLAKGAANRGRLALFTLRLDDRLLAFQFGLVAGGVLEDLKESYDPEFARYSPSNALRAFILVEEAERRRIRTYRLGIDAEWKRRWATGVEPFVRLRIYDRSLRGRVAYAAGPAARARLKRIRWLLGAVRLARRWLGRD